MAKNRAGATDAGDLAGRVIEIRAELSAALLAMGQAAEKAAAAFGELADLANGAAADIAPADNAGAGIDDPA